eukprot:UN10924
MASKPLLRAVQSNVKNFIQSQSQSFVRSSLKKSDVAPAKIKAFTGSINPTSSTPNRLQNPKYNMHSVASSSFIQEPPKANPKKTINSKCSNCAKSRAQATVNGNDWGTFGVVFATCVASLFYVNYYDESHETDLTESQQINGEY